MPTATDPTPKSVLKALDAVDAVLPRLTSSRFCFDTTRPERNAAARRARDNAARDRSYGSECDDPEWLRYLLQQAGLPSGDPAESPGLTPERDAIIDSHQEKLPTHRANWVRAAVALATTAGITDAAQQCGLSVRTLQRLVRKPEFVELLRHAQQRAVDQAMRRHALHHLAHARLEELLASQDERVALRAAQALHGRH